MARGAGWYTKQFEGTGGGGTVELHWEDLPPNLDTRSTAFAAHRVDSRRGASGASVFTARSGHDIAGGPRRGAPARGADRARAVSGGTRCVSAAARSPYAGAGWLARCVADFRAMAALGPRRDLERNRRHCAGPRARRPAGRAGAASRAIDAGCCRSSLSRERWAYAPSSAISSPATLASNFCTCSSASSSSSRAIRATERC